MQRAFVITLELDDGDDVNVLAADLQDDLESQGYAVLSVNPWDASGMQTPNQTLPLA